MSRLLTAIIGGASGAITLLVLIVAWFCILQRRKLSDKSSDADSSDSSATAQLPEDLKRGVEPSSLATTSVHTPNGARQFTIEELKQATKNFDNTNFIGYGNFGQVFKGLLHDGTVVAVKRRAGVPRQELAKEVHYLSGIQHRHLVTLLGYCQDNGYQILVFEYVPNGSMSSHLYDTGNSTKTKLEFKQRLAIALGAAKGLCHMHGQLPALIHGNFKTANVLVDENFIAKVADAGILKLLEKIEDAGPSQLTGVDIVKDNKADQMRMLTEMNDVYNFGIFLLELITGRQAQNIESFESNETLLQWMEIHLSSDDFLDNQIIGSFTQEGIQDFIRLMLQCMGFQDKERLKMETVALALDHILEKEIILTTVMGEGRDTVTLGSHLFTI